MGRGSGQVLSVIVFYCNNPSSNPAKVKLLFQRMKRNKKSRC